MGLRSLEDGYVPPILDVSKLDRKVLVSNAESVQGLRALLDAEGIFAGVSAGRGRPRRPEARGRARRGRGRLRSRRRRLEVPLRAVLGRRRRRGSRWRRRSGGDPRAHPRASSPTHARAEEPNEACGLIAFRDGVAERYVRAGTRSPRPTASSSEIDPDIWFLEDEGYELAVFHSHISSPPRPSRTDVENIGLWEGRPYVILSLRTGELAAWRIAGREIGEVTLAP